MTSKQELQALARRTGGRLEEDEGYREMRVFQLVAPAGKLWTEGVRAIRLEMSTARTPQALAYNRALLREAGQRAVLRDMLPDELDLYATD